MTDEGEIVAALESYGLDGAAASRLPGGMINANFRVACAGRDFVLKRYASGLREFDPDRIGASLETQEVVRSRGVPAPAVVRNIEGGLYTVVDGVCYSLCEFVDGFQYPRGQMPLDCARSMGTALAAVHEALADLPITAPRVLPEPAALVERYQELLGLVQRRGATDTVDAIAADLLRARIRALEAWRGPAPLPTPHWTHSDYQDSNLIFTETGAVAAIIDWDIAGCTSRANEVMRAFAFSFPEGAPESFEFLRAYVLAAKPPPEEASAFVDFWDYIKLFRIWPIDVRYEAPDLYQARWDEFIRPPTGWWEANRDHLRDTMARFAESAR